MDSILHPAPLSFTRLRVATFATATSAHHLPYFSSAVPATTTSSPSPPLPPLASPAAAAKTWSIYSWQLHDKERRLACGKTYDKCRCSTGHPCGKQNNLFSYD